VAQVDIYFRADEDWCICGHERVRHVFDYGIFGEELPIRICGSSPCCCMNFKINRIKESNYFTVDKRF